MVMMIETKEIPARSRRFFSYSIVIKIGYDILERRGKTKYGPGVNVSIIKKKRSVRDWTLKRPSIMKRSVVLFEHVHAGGCSTYGVLRATITTRYSVAIHDAQSILHMQSVDCGAC